MSEAKIATVVAVLWPDYSQMLGMEVIEQICDDVRAGRNPLDAYKTADGGEHFDLSGIVGLIADTATIASLAFQVWAMRRQHGEKLTASELRSEVAADAEKLDLPPMVLEKVPEIVTLVLEEDSREGNGSVA